MEYVPEILRGNAFCEEVIRHSSSHIHSPNMSSETEIVHISRKYQNKCAMITMIGARSQKTLWYSGAGRCIISYDCYNSLHPKYKAELFPSSLKIRAANGTFIPNRGESDVILKIRAANGMFIPNGENVMSPSKSTRRGSHSHSFVQTNPTVPANDTWP